MALQDKLGPITASPIEGQAKEKPKVNDARFHFISGSTIESILAGDASDRPSPRFPVPEVVNVKEEWTPVSHGNPLKDATLYYAPPSLERVRLSEGGRGRVSVGRSDHRGRARSGDAVFQPDEQLVIAAQPMRDDEKKAYSVYGTPGINYSDFYTNPPTSSKKSKKKSLPKKRKSGRSSKRYDRYRATSRVDRFDYDDAEDERDPLKEFVETRAEMAVRQHKGIGGGIQYMEPPNR